MHVIFEAAAALGRESREPGRVIPRAIIFSLLGATVFFVLVTYALSVGYGVDHAARWAADPAPLDTIVGRYTGSAWAQVIDALVAVSAFSSGLGLVSLTSRIVFEIGKTGSAPKVFTRVHRRYGTPYLGVVAVVAVIVALGLIAGLLTSANTLIGVAAGANTLADIACYAGIAAALIWVSRPYRLTRPLTFLIGIGVPAVAIILLAFAFKTSVIPAPAFPYNIEPYLVIGVTVIALGYALWLRSRRGTARLASFEAGTARAEVIEAETPRD